MAPKRSSSYQSSVFPVVVLAHFVAAAIATLVLVWLLHFRGGLAFKSDNKNKIFNVHPLLMVIGFILIIGEAIMAYKTVPARRERQKVIHMLLQLVAIVAGVVGIYAVFKFHNESGIINMYSLHSWFGITTICLSALQWLFSFFSFFYPGTRPSARDRLAPWHAVIGILIFFLAILTAEIGLIEKFFFLGLRRSQEALIVNFTGVLIFIFAVSVGLTVVLSRTYG